MQPDRRTRLCRLLRGVASIPDLFATRAPTVPRHRDGLAADRKALAGDWQRVGDDLRRSMARVTDDDDDPGFDAWLRQVDADMEASVRAALDARTCCSPEAFAPLLQHLGEQLEAHADRDGLTGVRRAVFLARGGHAPGDACPSELPADPDPHAYWCGAPEEPCRCGVED